VRPRPPTQLDNPVLRSRTAFIPEIDSSCELVEWSLVVHFANTVTNSGIRAHTKTRKARGLSPPDLAKATSGGCKTRPYGVSYLSEYAYVFMKRCN
jgi:hypothetical protein